MKIKMVETRIMPFGVFAEGETYDTDKMVDLSVGQAKTFIMCGAAIDDSYSSGVIETEPVDGWRTFKKTKKKVKT